MRKFKTLDEFTDRYFREHPEEIDDYVTEIFEDYAFDSDAGALLNGLRIVARARGISDIAEKSGMTRRGIQKALSDTGNPRLGNIMLIMREMGYCLLPHNLSQSTPLHTEKLHHDQPQAPNPA